MTTNEDSTNQELVDAARDQYGTNEVLIYNDDGKDHVDRTDDGAWVKAWVWVAFDKEDKK